MSRRAALASCRRAPITIQFLPFVPAPRVGSSTTCSSYSDDLDFVLVLTSPRTHFLLPRSLFLFKNAMCVIVVLLH